MVLRCTTTMAPQAGSESSRSAGMLRFVESVNFNDCDYETDL